MKYLARFTAIILGYALFISNVNGQVDGACDTLVLKTGKRVLAHIKSVGAREVAFSYCGQTEGQTSLAPWASLEEIRYANGVRRNQLGNVLNQGLTDSLWIVETSDDNVYYGLIRELNAEFIVLETTNLGKLTIARSTIRKMGPVLPGQIKNGEIWYDNPQATRYLFGPNGYNLRKGEAYYQNVWIFFNQISYGVTNNFTVGVGIVPLFLFGAASPVWLTPKVTFPIKKDKVNLGVGALLATVSGSDNGGSFGVAYGQLTLGSRDKNVNFGLGYGYAGDSWANSPTLSFSTLLRGSKKFAFISENYFIDAGSNNIGLISAGFRYLGRSVTIDAALVAPVGLENDFIALPWLGINVPVGKKKT